MPVRHPACEPCRVAKSACDHARPVCSRCQEAERGHLCIYRSAPFKRRRTRTPESVIPATTTTFVSPSLLPRTKQPDSGYLGSSSHATIFRHLPADVTSGEIPASEPAFLSSSSIQTALPEVNHADLSRGAAVVEAMQTALPIASCRKLVEAWNARGIDLALAGPYVKDCSAAVEQFLLDSSQGAANLSQRLMEPSGRPVGIDAQSTADAWTASFCKPSPKWEACGIFWCAVSRAMTDFGTFEPLFRTEKERSQFQAVAMHLSDCCLDLAISMDRLDDLQLMLQYENFILHSYVDGDQSYRAWRKLGDVIGSLYALGYHEQPEDDPFVPPFLVQIRRTAFARAYSADKNLAIFLGRPLRMHSRYCQFYLPGEYAIPCGRNNESFIHHQVQWSAERQPIYTMDTCWSALCASLKEEVLDLACATTPDEQLRRARDVQRAAEMQWVALPEHLRLSGPLSRLDEGKIERDLMVSIRLNYLHVVFFARLKVAHYVAEPDEELIGISEALLDVTVQAITLKEQLDNSGTGLVWKVAHYGLPAAGVLCLGLLNRPTPLEGVDIFTVVQNLHILVAEIEAGALVPEQHSAHAFFSTAAKTIKVVLMRCLHLNSSTDRPNLSIPDGASVNEGGDWGFDSLEGMLEFENDFWTNLAGHPSLSIAGVEGGNA